MAAKQVIIAGLTTIYWGTKGLINSPTSLAGIIIEGCPVTPKNAGLIGEIENGDGATVSMQALDDGFEAKPKFVYDKSVTYPAIGDEVILNLPKIGAAGGAQTYSCMLVSATPDIQRKQGATMEFTLVHRPGVEVATKTTVSNLA
jgi:hypothetical protein